ncbi:MAG: tRNA (N6-threonylcarbamoyladenosine(37)-N6)-methyltransferase TrmO [Eubacteriales bacterium]|nr:tRNA (N6-threonylcarbamoyladenosine(37)-N6)-methyltransferase TrmO [Eubacteriales bacterium]
MKIIGYVKSDFPTKFAIPRQSGVVPDIQARIVFEAEYNVKEAFRGLEEYSHIWVLWQFSESVREDWSPTVRPPKLGGNKRVGVFATRSPFRPNSIGLSSVKLERVEFDENAGVVLHISGADIMDNTPVYDIKPYIAYTDSHPDALCSFALPPDKNLLTVDFPAQLSKKIPPEKIGALISVLEQDPRPAYIDDDRRYGFVFAGFEVGFRVKDGILKVESVE